MMVNHAYLVKLAHRASDFAGPDENDHFVCRLFVGLILNYLIETGKTREADDLCFALGHGWEYLAPSATPGDPKGDLHKLQS